MARALRFLLLFILTTGSVCAADTPAKKSGNRATPPTPPATAKDDAKAAKRSATHCRIGHEDRGNRELHWKITRISTIDDLVSQENNHYQLIETYSNNYIGNPSVSIKQDDKVWTKKNGERTLSLTFLGHSNGIPNELRTSELTLDGDNLWASGDIRDEQNQVLGTVVLYLRPDREYCMHSNVKPVVPGTNNPSCRRVLVEYFDKKDDESRKDFPKYSATGQNVFDGLSKCTGGGDETNDGDGDEGPNKPK